MNQNPVKYTVSSYFLKPWKAKAKISVMAIEEMDDCVMGQNVSGKISMDQNCLQIQDVTALLVWHMTASYEHIIALYH